MYIDNIKLRVIAGYILLTKRDNEQLYLTFSSYFAEFC